MRIAGRVVIVTGAASGIGRATALALGRQGATVVAVDRNADPIAKVAAETGGAAITLDVTDPQHGEHVVRETLRQYGRLDVVIANAGVGWVGQFAEMSIEEISALLEVNFRAPMLLTRAALPVLLDRPRDREGHRGAIVFTSSIGGTVPVPRETAYCTSKAALESFADALRDEVREAGVVVSVVRPGVVGTAFHERRNEPYRRRFPRVIGPEQISDAIIDVLAKNTERRTVPSWLAIASEVRHVAPGFFAAMSRRFGGT